MLFTKVLGLREPPVSRRAALSPGELARTNVATCDIGRWLWWASIFLGSFVFLVCDCFRWCKSCLAWGTADSVFVMDEGEFGEYPGPEEVLDAFRKADSPASWLVEEVCNYLFTDIPESELTDRIARFDEVMTEERRRMLDSIATMDDVVLFSVFIEREDVDEFLSFKSCPSAAFLLETCAQIAESGDLVRLELVYGDGSRAEYSLKWPFPMYVAVEVTTPALRDAEPGFQDFFTIVDSSEAPQDGLERDVVEDGSASGGGQVEESCGVGVLPSEGTDGGDAVLLAGAAGFCLGLFAGVRSVFLLWRKFGSRKQ